MAPTKKASTATSQEQGAGSGGSSVPAEWSASMETRVARVEEIMEGHVEALKSLAEVDDRLKALEDEWENRVLETINALNREIRAEIEVVRGEVRATAQEMRGVRAMLEDYGARIELLERTPIGARSTAAVAHAKIDVPKPNSYSGARSAKELDNFIWNLEQYFEGSGVRDDREKLRVGPLFLADTAMLWWRRTCGEIEARRVRMESWADFKAALKKQFYPTNAEWEARSRLKRIAHTKSVRQYIKEFQETILEIPTLTDQETLFAFLDGLKPWARMELQRAKVQTLAEAISVAERLIEITPRERSEHRDEDQGDTESRGARNGKPKDRDKGKAPAKSQGNEKKGRLCYYCQGTDHWQKDCPVMKRVAAMALKDSKETEEQGEDASLGAMELQLLNAAKRFEPGAKKGTLLFVDAMVGATKVKALVDTGASHNFIREELAEELRLEKTHNRGAMLKSAYAPAKLVNYEAKDVGDRKSVV